MSSRLRNYLGLASAYVWLNFKAQLEYRGAFISQAAAMFLNNGAWVVFWVVFFTRFPALRGWDLKDYITLWAICAGGFGLANSICGNGWHIQSLIARGQLEVWMLYPRALLPHLLVGRMNPTAVGDAAFGFAAYLLFVRHDPLHVALFTLLTVAVAFLFVGFNVMTGSLAFYLGNVEGLVEQWRFAMITFSTYPATLFEGAVKIVLYTVIPAGFISFLPIEALRSLSMTHALLTVAGAGVFLALGVSVFYHGLSRYESGNLMEMRG